MYSGTTGYTNPGFTSPQHSAVTPVMPGTVSPSTSGFGVGLMSPSGGGSPIMQYPSANKFPTQGGQIVFTPHSNTSPGGGVTGATPVSPYSYVGGTATSLIQQSAPAYGGPTALYSSPPYCSTMVSNAPHHVHAASPVGHGYGHLTQYANVQPYGYGVKALGGSYVYHHPYQPHQAVSPYYGHHSPRDEIVEPMHCSPVGHAQPHTNLGSPPYQPLHRSPTNPPRPSYMPAYFTGVDHVVAAVPPRPRRVFDRSPSTSPPAVAVGSRSPQSKSPTWLQQEGGGQQTGTGYSAQLENASPTSGAFGKRVQAQPVGKQLKFTDTQYFQDLQAAEDKEKAKRTGPPVRGFGTSEEINNFINSPLLKDNSNSVPGAAIALEAVAKAGVSAPIAESNWITVFGFPAAAASFILTHFSQYGSVIQSKSNPGGNWLHVQYASRIDARRALACNGKVLGGTIMVGVVSSPKEVIDTYEKSRDLQQPSPGSSTNQQAQMKSPLQERNADSTDPGKSRIRPLAGTTQLSGVLTSPILSGEKSVSTSASIVKDSKTTSQNETHNENVPLPTASSGILTKAMEYMFGW